MNDEWLKDTLKRHDERLQRHSERIDKLENTQSEMAVKIENLCNTIDKLASNLNKRFNPCFNGTYSLTRRI